MDIVTSGPRYERRTRVLAEPVQARAPLELKTLAERAGFSVEVTRETLADLEAGGFAWPEPNGSWRGRLL